MTDRIYALRQGAVLAALALALMAIQFSVTGSFVVLTWLVPLVFSCAAARLPFRVLLMLTLGTTGGCLLLFGIVTAVWAVFYALYGMVVGVAHRARAPFVLRVVLSASAFWVCFQVVIALLIWLVGLSGAVPTDGMYDLFQRYYGPVAASLAVLAMANATVCVTLTRNVFQRLGALR